MASAMLESGIACMGASPARQGAEGCGGLGRPRSVVALLFGRPGPTAIAD